MRDARGLTHTLVRHPSGSDICALFSGGNCEGIPEQLQDFNSFFSGTLPAAALASLKSTDDAIDITYTMLSGTLPTELGTLTNLKHLFLSGNRISGTIPSELGRVSWDDLFLDSNYLSGTVPSSLFAIENVVCALTADQCRHRDSDPEHCGLNTNRLCATRSGGAPCGNCGRDVEFSACPWTPSIFQRGTPLQVSSSALALAAILLGAMVLLCAMRRMRLAQYLRLALFERYVNRSDVCSKQQGIQPQATSSGDTSYDHVDLLT